MKKLIKEEVAEDYCFNCKDGGPLRICDYGRCLKSYHPECVQKDDMFLFSEERWCCGRHYCLICNRASKFECLSCPKAVCNRRSCTFEAEFVLVRGKKGFCSHCLHLVELIEENRDVDSDGGKVDFTERETYECLFKDYWEFIKVQERITSEHVQTAKASFKKGPHSRFELVVDEKDNEEDREVVSDYEDTGEEEKHYRPNKRKRPSNQSRAVIRNVKPRTQEFMGWGSKELVTFLESVGKDTSHPLSQHDVESIVIEYVHEKKLLHPEKKKTVVCDAKLQSLFRKKTVNKHRLYNLLDIHFSQNKEQNGQLSDFGGYSSEEEGDKESFPCKRGRKQNKNRKAPLKEGATDIQKTGFASMVYENIKLVYLKRTLVEELLKTPETFEPKLVGSFVRVKSDPHDYMQKHSHQLVQVIGIRTDFCLSAGCKEVLLQVTTRPKPVAVSLVSDEDLSKEECEDLHQRMANGLLRKITVAELQTKARSLHEDITKHWIAKQLMLLTNQIDQANEKGWRKELLEYMEQKELLEKSTEQTKLLQELPEVIAEVVTLKPTFEDHLEETPKQEFKESLKLDATPQMSDEISSKKLCDQSNSFPQVGYEGSALASTINGSNSPNSENGKTTEATEHLQVDVPIHCDEEFSRSSKGSKFLAKEAQENRVEGEAANEESQVFINLSPETLSASLDTDAVFADIDQLISVGASIESSCSPRDQPYPTVEEMVPTPDTIFRMQEILKDCLSLDFQLLIYSDKKQDFLDALPILLRHVKFPSEQVLAIKDIQYKFSTYCSLYQHAEDTISKYRGYLTAHTSLVEELKTNGTIYETVKVKEKELDSASARIEADILQLQQKFSDIQRKKKKVLVEKQDLAAKTMARKDKLYKSNKYLSMWKSTKKQAEDSRANVLSAWQSFQDCFDSLEEKKHVQNELCDEKFREGGIHQKANYNNSGRRDQLIDTEQAKIEHKNNLQVIELSDDDERKLLVFKKTQIVHRPVCNYSVSMEEFEKKYNEKHPDEKPVLAVAKDCG